MEDIVPNVSRRALIGVLATAPVMAATAALPSHRALASLYRKYGDETVTLARSREGRSLSLARYHRAEEFLPDGEPQSGSSWHQFLYMSGIAAQLGISAHLLDVGFSDTWCANYIGLHVSKSLDYANATGFGYDRPAMTRLATVLTPYWKWNRPTFLDRAPDDGAFTLRDVNGLLRDLLDHVHRVTGHRRPRGWNRRERSRASFDQ